MMSQNDVTQRSRLGPARLAALVLLVLAAGSCGSPDSADDLSRVMQPGDTIAVRVEAIGWLTSERLLYSRADVLRRSHLADEVLCDSTGVYSADPSELLRSTRDRRFSCTSAWRQAAREYTDADNVVREASSQVFSTLSAVELAGRDSAYAVRACAGTVSGISWSPSAGLLALVAECAGRYEGRALSLARWESALNERVLIAGVQGKPSWSANGRLLAVEGQANERDGVEILILSPAAVVRDSVVNGRAPAFGPRGSVLAFTRARAKDSVDIRTIAWNDANRGPEVHVASLPYCGSLLGRTWSHTAFHLRWSPDGRRIAISNGSCLWVLEAERGTLVSHRVFESTTP